MAGSSDTYKVGLHNVGSYQASGRPWLKSNSIADEEVQAYAFPNVTKEIHVCNDHNAQSHTLNVAFPEPRMGVNLTALVSPDENTNFATTFDRLSVLTISFWFKYEQTSSAKRILTLSSTSNDEVLRIQNNGTSFRIVATDPLGTGSSAATAQNTVSGLIVVDTWQHLTLTLAQSAGAIKLYVDGVDVSPTTQVFRDEIEKISLGHPNGTNFDGYYSNAFLFSNVLDAGQSYALFNGVGRDDPRNHSSSGTLVSWWAFENNFYKNYFATPDTGLLVYDRISTNNLILGAGASGDLLLPTFELGPQTSRAFANGQFFKLIGKQQVDISAKCIFMAVQCDGGVLEYSIFSSLTGIPAERMKDIGTYE